MEGKYAAYLEDQYDISVSFVHVNPCLKHRKQDHY